MESIKSLYKNNKQVFITYLVFTIIGIIFIPIIVIFNQLDILDIRKIMDYKTYINLNIIFLLGLIVYKLICSNKKSMNILLLWCYVHLSSSIFLLFSGIIDYSKLYSVISGFNISSVSYFVLSTVAIFYFNYLIKKEKKCSKNKESKTIYESRKDKAGYLTKLLTAKEKNMILIDGEWGIGKSYFVDSIVEKIEEYHKIFVDVLLFSDKEQLINHTLNEINTILVNSGIRSNAINKYKGILKVISESIPIKFGHFLENDSLEIIEKNIEKDLEKLGKPVYIIVDNLERILEMRRIIDILGFLHKIYEIGDNSLNIIVLADSSKLIREDITSEYLQKFFPKTIFLRQINKYEILEAECNYINNKLEELKNSELEKDYCISLGFNPFNSFKFIFESLEYLNQKISKRNDVQPFKDYYTPRFRAVIENLNNARNIRYIINKSFDNLLLYKNIFKCEDRFTEEFYFREVILTTIFKEFFEGEIKQVLNSLNIQKFKSPVLEGSMIQSQDFEISFVLLFFKEMDFLRNTPNEIHGRISRSLVRLLKDSGKTEEDFSLLYMGKILNNDFSNLTFMDCNLYFKIYTEYLDRKNNSEEIYQKIMANYYENLKFDSISDIVNLNNKEILIQDKLYSIKNNRSFFDKINFVMVPIQKEMIENFITAYSDELKCYSEYYLKSDKLIASFDDFKTIYEECTLLKFDDFKSIIKHINNNSFNKDNNFLKTEFELLGKKMSTIANRENYPLISNTITNLTSEIEKYKELELEISKNITTNLKSLYNDKYNLRIIISHSLLFDFRFMLGNFIHFPSDSSDREYIINFIRKTPRVFYNEIIQAINTLEYDTFKKLFDLDFLSFLLNVENFKSENIINNIKTYMNILNMTRYSTNQEDKNKLYLNSEEIYKKIFLEFSKFITPISISLSNYIIMLLFEEMDKVIEQNEVIKNLKERINREISNSLVQTN